MSTAVLTSRYLPGYWCGLFGRQFWLLADASPNSLAVQGWLQLLQRRADPDTIIEEIGNIDDWEVAHLAAVACGEGALRFLARGNGYVEFIGRTGGADVQADGSDAKSLIGIARVRLLSPVTDPDHGILHPVPFETGFSLAAAIELTVSLPADSSAVPLHVVPPRSSMPADQPGAGINNDAPHQKIDNRWEVTLGRQVDDDPTSCGKSAAEGSAAGETTKDVAVAATYWPSDEARRPAWSSGPPASLPLDQGRGWL